VHGHEKKSDRRIASRQFSSRWGPTGWTCNNCAKMELRIPPERRGGQETLTLRDLAETSFNALLACGVLTGKKKGGEKLAGLQADIGDDEVPHDPALQNSIPRYTPGKVHGTSGKEKGGARRSYFSSGKQKSRPGYDRKSNPDIQPVRKSIPREKDIYERENPVFY